MKNNIKARTVRQKEHKIYIHVLVHEQNTSGRTQRMAASGEVNWQDREERNTLILVQLKTCEYITCPKTKFKALRK